MTTAAQTPHEDTIQNMQDRVQDLFQWLQKTERISVIYTCRPFNTDTVRITLQLPDYDNPQNPEEDHLIELPLITLNNPQEDRRYITIQITYQILSAIPYIYHGIYPFTDHLFHNFQIDLRRIYLDLTEISQ